jgi:hypothetical protein
MRLINFIMALIIGISAQAKPTAQEIVKQVNKFRKEQGLAAAKLHPGQTKAAQAHADWVASTGIYAHEQTRAANGLPLMIGPWDRGDYFGATVVAENLYLLGKFATAEHVVDGWINSPGHRKNMLYQVGDYPELECRIGIGIAFLKSDPDQMIVVLVMGDNVDRNTGEIRKEAVK